MRRKYSLLASQLSPSLRIRTSLRCSASCPVLKFKGLVGWWRRIEPQNCNIFCLFCSRILHVWIFMWFRRIFIDSHVKLSFNFHFAWPRWRPNLRQYTSSVPRFPELTFHSEARLGLNIQDGRRTSWKVWSPVGLISHR